MNLLVRIWNKLDSNPLFYFRLLWSVVVLRRSLVIIDFGGSLGDLVCFCASLPGLRERHGRCFILFVTARPYLDLVRSTGLADLAAAPYGLSHEIAKRLCPAENYYTPTQASPAAAGTKNVNPPIHTAVHFAEILGVRPQIDAVRLKPVQKMRLDLQRRLRFVNEQGFPVVVVHVGPTWTVKEWPAELWDQWSTMMHDELKVCVIQIGTETSSSVLHNHAMSRLPHAVDWRNQLDVMESVSLLEQAQVFVGIDSGPLHLATTLGIPSIGLFGPVTGELRAHPRAPFICLTADVPCLGCHHDPAGEQHWRTGCAHDIRCMRNISPEDVFRAVKISLEGQKPFLVEVKD